MREIASPGQLRMALLRWIVVLVPLILLLGTVSGLGGASRANAAWYLALAKPAWTPAPSLIGSAWTVLYILMGIALAIIVAARGARGRGPAILAFVIQLALNLAWPPLFFAAHQVTLAFWWLVLLVVAVAVTFWLFYRIRPVAGLLLVPYLAWLLFAGVLAYTIDRLNPNGEALAPGSAATQIQL